MFKIKRQGSHYSILIKCLICIASVAAAEETVQFKFAWPDSGCVTINDVYETKLESAEDVFELCWKSTEGDKNLLLVEHRDLRVTNYNGKALSAEEQSNLFPIMSNIPSFYVNKNNGEFLEVEREQLHKTFKSMSESYAQQAGMSEQEVMEIFRNSETLKTEITRTLAKKWYVWVEAWQGDFEVDTNYESKDENTNLIISTKHMGQYSFSLQTNLVLEEKETKINPSIREAKEAVSGLSYALSASATTDQSLRTTQAKLTLRKLTSNPREPLDYESYNYSIDWDSLREYTVL